MKRLIALFLLMVVISFSAFGKAGAIVRGNLEYVTPSLVSNISPEYEEYKSGFKLDDKILEFDIKFSSFFWSANREVYSLIKEIFPEDVIYDDVGNYIINYIACFGLKITSNIIYYIITHIIINYIFREYLFY